MRIKDICSFNHLYKVFFKDEFLMNLGETLGKFQKIMQKDLVSLSLSFAGDLDQGDIIS